MNTLGIDFGTSNSAAGVMVGGRPFLIEIDAGETTLPTALFFDEDDNSLRYGRGANEALFAGNEGRYMRALKSVLGTSLMHEERRMQGKTVTFVDIIATFLRHIKIRAEAACFQDFECALSGRPVQFHSSDSQRNDQALKDLTECYLRAGFKEVTFLNEPEAAAIATGASKVSGLGLIVDIGGGTSDFTLFESTSDGVRTLASHGIRLGGTNFDRSLSINHVMPLLGRGTEVRRDFGPGTLSAPIALFNDLATWEKIPFLYAPETIRDAKALAKLAVEPEKMSRLVDVLELRLGHEIAFSVERGKIRANDPECNSAQIDLRVIEKDLVTALTKNDLKHSLRTHMVELETALNGFLLGTDPAKINRVIYVGGSSLLAGVEATFRKVIPDASHDHSDVFTAVIRGLAMAARN